MTSRKQKGTMTELSDIKRNGFDPEPDFYSRKSKLKNWLWQVFWLVHFF